MSSELIEYFKQDIRGKYIMEIKVWKLTDKRYVNGLKYSFIFLEYKTKKRVLMDNHYPKKPHVHIDQAQIDYDFKNVDKLFSDFRALVFEHFGEKI